MVNAIEIKNLSKKYKGFELKNINLRLPMGCIMGLVGENGAGKSTVIRLILDIISRDSGEITVLGKSNRDRFEITKQDIGVVLDDISLYAGFNAKDINSIMKRAYNNWSEETFFNYLKKFNVPDNKKILKLSKGMKMKLSIAVALSHDAKLLILDEATGGLDPVIRDEIINIFGEFTRDENHAVLISSHITCDLEKICDYFAFLRKGELVLCQEKDRLLEKYGIIRLSAEDFQAIDPNSVIGKKESPYGIEAVVNREMLPNGLEASPIDIEELFIYMMKEGRDDEELAD